MNRLLCLLPYLVLVALPATAREFTIVAYNVENLFDIDGEALFDDYEQDGPDDPYAYSPRKLLTKLRNTTRALQALQPDGPEVILFQELENDFTPDSGVDDFDRFLRATRGLSVERMLEDPMWRRFEGLPAAAWLLKQMDESGLSGYHVVVAEPKDPKSGIAHTNAVFSKFPVTEVRRHEIENARDILEVELDVDGRPLVVYCNHWKSGASSPDREPIRAQNAGVLRDLVAARLEEDPLADIVIGGDLNSHYNHALLFPDLRTGINDVLGSQGDEAAVLDRDGQALYNLWHELEPEARYSEVWRGRKGTLMHLIVSRGLYDEAGIQYLDGSFGVLVRPGINADAAGRPVEWSFAGTGGGGVSDHFPVFARFRTVDGDRGDFVVLDNPSDGSAPDKEIRFDLMASVDPEKLPDGAFVMKLPPDEMVGQFGKLFVVEGTVFEGDTTEMAVEVGGESWQAYVPDPQVAARLRDDRDRVRTLVVRGKIWKGAPEWVIEAELED